MKRIALSSALIVGSFLISGVALAAVIVTPATGGSAISADTTGATTTSLTGPIITEGAVGEIGIGTIILNTPAGFIFSTTSNSVTATRTNGNGCSGPGNGVLKIGTNDVSQTVTPSSTSISINVTATSSGTFSKCGGTITFTGIKVRPSSGTPLATGNVTKAGTSAILGVTNGTTNFGTLTEVVGAVNYITVTPSTPQSVTYGSTLAFSAQGYDQFNNTISGLTYTWGVTNGTGSGTINSSGTFTATGFGSSTVTAATSSKTGTSGTITINKKPVTINVDTKAKNYGDVDPTLSYTYTGSLVSPDAFSGSLSRNIGEDVGSYAINQNTLALNANYAVTFNGANLSIGQKTLDITADPINKIYGEVDPTLTYSASGTLVSGDSFTGSLSRDAGEDVNAYSINLDTLSAGTNYNLNYTGNTFTINQRPITVTAASGTKRTGEIDPELTYASSEALILGNSFSGALSRLAGELVGIYPIDQGNLTAGNNYSITFVGADFEITRRAKRRTVISATTTDTQVVTSETATDTVLGTGTSTLVVETPAGTSTPIVEVSTSTQGAIGEVLGVEKFFFAINLKLGSRKGPDVTELQNRLATEGFFTAGSTGYFGPKTKIAVKAYQKAHGIAQTGLVGILTRGELNK